VSPWKLPLIVAAIAVPIAFAFYLGGPGIGVGVGAMVAVGIVYVAVRERPRGGIGPPPGDADPHRVLVVLADRLEQPQAIEEVSSSIADSGQGARVTVLAPAHIGFLDRWASDVEAARRDAQQRLVVSVAALAAAGVDAEARVGDEDIVQAVEDQLGSSPAATVIMVYAGSADAVATRAARELRARLRTGFRQVLTDPATR
jgi:hypothetical protein